MKYVYAYIKVGLLLHIVTALELIIIIFVYAFLYWHVKDNSITIFYLLIRCCVLLPLFPQLDAYSRYQNYKQLRDLFYVYGFEKRIAKKFTISRCQRDAVMQAAKELGYVKQCKEYFYANGYRWYHFFPDFVFSNPKFLLSKKFITTTFLVKRYHSKIKYASIHQIKNKTTTNLLAV